MYGMYWAAYRKVFPASPASAHGDDAPAGASETWGAPAPT
jgi:hypothetical protein